MLTVSIVIHNSPADQVMNALDCILRSQAEKVYLIDNGSEPFDTALLEGRPRVEYRIVPNNGFGAGHNVAIRECISLNPDGYHLVMNADVEWTGDVLAILVGYMETHPDTGLVQPRIVYGDGMLQYTCRLLPTPLDLFAKRFLPSPLKRKRMERYLLADHDHHQPLNVAYLQGSFLLFRNKALAECGRFDERFFMYPEDIDITRRLHRSWKTLYLPIVEVTHYHQAASRRNLKMFGIHLVNMWRYFNKWGWWIDSERRAINRRILGDLIPPLSGEHEEGRG